ncbi:MAG: hypothetical protein ACE361_25105 [Aureliella sp.]
MVAVESDGEVLVPGAFDRAADTLSGVIASDDPDLLAVDVEHGFDVAGLVELEERTFGLTGDRAPAWSDTTRRNLDEINDVLRMADSDDSPLDSGFSRIPSPKNLRGSLRLGFKDEAGR